MRGTREIRFQPAADGFLTISRIKGGLVWRTRKNRPNNDTLEDDHWIVHSLVHSLFLLSAVGSSLFPSCLSALRRFFPVSEEHNRAIRRSKKRIDRLLSFPFLFLLFNRSKIFVEQHTMFRFEDDGTRHRSTEKNGSWSISHDFPFRWIRFTWFTMSQRGHPTHPRAGRNRERDLQTNGSPYLIRIPRRYGRRSGVERAHTEQHVRNHRSQPDSDSSLPPLPAFSLFSKLQFSTRFHLLPILLTIAANLNALQRSN